MPKVDGHATKRPGSVINIRYASGGGYIVTIDASVNHRCADMEAVIELLRKLQHSETSAVEEPGEEKSEP